MYSILLVENSADMDMASNALKNARLEKSEKKGIRETFKAHLSLLKEKGFSTYISTVWNQIEALVDRFITKYDDYFKDKPKMKTMQRAAMILNIVLILYLPVTLIITPIIRKVLTTKVKGKLDSAVVSSVMYGGVKFFRSEEERDTFMKARDETIVKLTNLEKNTKAFETIIVAPLVEEWGKKLAVKYKCHGSFQFLFNLLEFTAYVVQLSMLTDLPKSTIIKLRTYAVGMHLGTGAIHQWFPNKNTAYVVSVLAHGIWNAFAVYKDKAFQGQ